MATTAEITAEILTSLPCFGLWVTKRQAESIAELYADLRPKVTADKTAAAFLAVSGLDWDQDDEPSTKLLVMQSLVGHLDGLNFVETC
jgi:hypothetical protein